MADLEGLTLLLAAVVRHERRTSNVEVQTWTFEHGESA
jgi:hypothetical protein